VVDRKIDLKMSRTLNRPVAKGSVSPYQALLFSTILGLIGMAILLVYINSLTAWLTLASLFGYAVLYTSYLKRATPQNIVIGGLAGAVPPLLGWTAVTGEIHGHALLLVLIIFAWTPPHFWALAVHRKDEYAKAEIPMLPVTHGEKYTKISILLYTVLMILVTLLPFAVGMSGWLYILGALILGAGFLYWAIMMMLDRNPNAGMDTFKYSIVYLMALFIIMLVDHYFI
jgi:protoheme IX farnesyltransferase